jgi:CheY-like chemotaxis protein
MANILIVDGEEVTAAGISSILGDEITALHIHHAASVRAFYRAHAAAQFDCIILNTTLPSSDTDLRIDFDAAARIVVHLDQIPLSPPVIIVTARWRSDPAMQTLAHASCVRSMVFLPFDDRELISAVRRCLSDDRWINCLRVQTGINKELLAYVRKHPDHMHNVTPRQFEEIIGELLRDMGYDVTVTPQTRDGGRDLLAVLHTPIGKMLTIVECKKYKPERKIGVDLVERFMWIVDQKDRASVGLFASTSSFSKEAQRLALTHKSRLQLADFDRLKEWIGQYGQWHNDREGGLWLPRPFSLPGELKTS